MTTATSINDLAIIPLIIGGAFALLTGGTYGIGSPWYKSLLGVAFFGLILSNVFVAVVPMLRRLFGEYPHFEIVAWTGYLMFAIVQVSMFAVVLKERRNSDLAPPISKKEKKHD